MIEEIKGYKHDFSYTYFKTRKEAEEDYIRCDKERKRNVFVATVAEMIEDNKHVYHDYHDYEGGRINYVDLVNMLIYEKVIEIPSE